jgi:hypothetical protein
MRFGDIVAKPAFNDAPIPKLVPLFIDPSTAVDIYDNDGGNEA